HMLLNVARGAPLVLLSEGKFDPEVFWNLVEKHRVSNLFTVPTIVKMLVEHESVDRYDHSSLRYMIYAGAPMYRADQKLALEKLGMVMVQYYGMGEVTGCIAYQPREMHAVDDEDPNANIGSCGIPRTGMEVAIFDEDMNRLNPGEVGEICCRGQAVCTGYYNNSEATAEAFRGGWFHSGDLAVMHPDGYIELRDRGKDIIISGGENISSIEVEQVIYRHPAVQEVAVIGIPHEKWGESPKAFVTLKQDQELTGEELIEFCRDNLSHFKCPTSVEFIELPKTSTG
ncbi:uncharacterized protein METZ01_LOCUS400143, partial [marine metagenome]